MTGTSVCLNVDSEASSNLIWDVPEIKNQKVCTIVQVRTGSTRLPLKSLRLILGKPMVYWVMERAQKANVNQTILVTTTLPQDDVLEDYAHHYDWNIFRHTSANNGDVLSLYYLCAVENQADIIIRLTGDNPLVDENIIDAVLAEFQRVKPDYCGNHETFRTVPLGLAVEVFSMEALKRAYIECNVPSLREHVTLYIRQNPDKFRIQPFQISKDYSAKRWTVDTKEDLEYIKQVFEAFGHGKFSWLNVIERGL